MKSIAFSPSSKTFSQQSNNYSIKETASLYGSLQALLWRLRQAFLGASFWRFKYRQSFWQKAKCLADQGKVEDLAAWFSAKQDITLDTKKVLRFSKWAYEQAVFFALERAYEAAKDGNQGHLVLEIKKIQDYQEEYQQYFGRAKALSLPEGLVDSLYQQAREA